MFRIFSSVICICLFQLACKSKEMPPPAVTPQTIEHTNTKGPEFTSKYVCPMHCKGSGSDSLGVCPVCGMDYVLNDNK